MRFGWGSARTPLGSSRRSRSPDPLIGWEGTPLPISYPARFFLSSLSIWGHAPKRFSLESRLLSTLLLTKSSSTDHRQMVYEGARASAVWDVNCRNCCTQTLYVARFNNLFAATVLPSTVHCVCRRTIENTRRFDHRVLKYCALFQNVAKICVSLCRFKKNSFKSTSRCVQ